MDRYLNLLTPVIEQHHLLGYGLAFAIALLETVLVAGLLLPGSTVLLLLGALSATQTIAAEYCAFVQYSCQPLPSPSSTTHATPNARCSTKR